MGKASREKNERKTSSVAAQKKKTDGRPWLFPVIVGGVVIIAIVAIVGFVVIGGGSDSGDSSDSGQSPTGESGGSVAAVGDQAPPLSGKNMTGDGTVSLSDMAGKPTLVVFWANWCPHCQAELPVVQQVWEAADGRYNVLTVASAQEANPTSAQYSTAEKFIETVGMTMPTIDDSDNKALDTWGVQGFPSIYVVDSSGKIVDQPSPGASASQLEQTLKSVAG